MLPVFAVAAAVTAASPKIVIVDVVAPDLMMGLGAQVTRMLVAEAQAQKFDVMTPDELRSKIDPKRYEALKKCGSQIACIAQHLEGLGLKRAVVGQLNRDERNYLLKLWLIDLSSLKVLSDVDRAILIAARRLQKDVEQAVPPFLRGEREARGTLVVRVDPHDAKVMVNGEVIAGSPATVSLRPGKYEVKVERQKYLSVTRLVAVEPNQENSLELKMLLAPGEVRDDQFVPALAKNANASSGSISTLTWVLGGTTVAAGGTALAFALMARSQENALRSGFNPESNSYQGTRTQALTQNRNATIANVGFGIAGAALIGTVISAVFDATRNPTQVAAVVTPSSVGVSVGGAF